MKEKYLVMVDPTQNHNKFYRLVDNNDGTCTAYWGRISNKPGNAVSSQQKNYPIHLFDTMLQKKLAKGYQDVSDYHLSQTVTVDKTSDSDIDCYIPDQNVRTLINYLIQSSRKILKKNYSVSPDSVSDLLILDAQETIDKMCWAAKRDDLDAFNNALIENMHIIPREMPGHGDLGVQAFLAKDISDFPAIIKRECDLLNVMETYKSVTSQTVQSENSHDKGKGTLLDVLGLEIRMATDEEKARVKRHINDSLRDKVRNVFAVTNVKTRKKFEKFVKTHNVTETKMFWHGSKNQNWLSILKKGLLLNSGSEITGKMFGNGIYFAPSAKKSWGYTSAHGSRWANGNSNTAFMAVFETAYGTPCVVDDWSTDFHDFNYRKLQRRQKGATCVFASKAKGMLHEDEVIFYKEEQVDIRYLVEFEG